MKIATGFRCIFVLMPIIIVAGCGLFSNSGTAVLVTNLPQVLSYAEQFNAEFESYKIKVVYRDTPWRYAESTQTNADIFVGRGLASRNVITKFAPMDTLLEEELIDSAEFYRSALALGSFQDQQLLLPLSFDLPAVLFHTEEGTAMNNPMVLNLDQLRTLSGEYTKEQSATTMGYSFRWEPEAAYTVLSALDADFHQTSGGLPAWNQQKLDQAVDYIRQWSKELNNGTEAENLFHSKYMYDPDYKLVSDRRIRFSFVTIEQFLTIPVEFRVHLDFRWFAVDGTIPVNEDIVFAGRHAQSKHQKASEAFITWLFDPEIQAQLLDLDRYRRIRGFGIAEGFSTLSSVNRNALTGVVPLLLTRIPPADILDFPPPVPATWPQIKKDVVYPWLAQSDIGEGKPLETLIKEWQLTNE